MPSLELLPRSQSGAAGTLNPNVTLANLEYDCKVSCLVIGKSDLPNELKLDLETMGKEYRDNLFVGFWDMGDPQLDAVAKEYELSRIPTIVITAPDQEAYVKLDERLWKKGQVVDQNLLEETKTLIRRMYISFLNGNIPQAEKDERGLYRRIFLRDWARRLGNFSEEFLRLLGEIGLTVEYGGAKVTLGQSKS